MTASETGADARPLDDGGTPTVELEGVSKRFPLDDSLLAQLVGEQTFVEAVAGVSLTVREGETLGIVGESGSGKSTLANLVTGLHAPTEGTVRIDGDAVGAVASRSSDRLADIGVVFQNAKSSIDPRQTVLDAIKEPLEAQGWSRERRDERVNELLELVNLSDQYASRRAHELSGGQAQRVAIARAIATNPSLLVLDEPVSALDVSVKGTIINLLMRLQRELDLTYLFISHDLSVVKHIADRIAVMYLGELMEVAAADRLFESPSHPYTEALLSAIPDVNPGTSIDEKAIPEGDVPSPVDPPEGCAFHTRCPIAEPECREATPEFVTVDGRRSKCHFAKEVATDE